MVKKVLVLVLLIVTMLLAERAVEAAQRTCSWDSVTTYTDNTAIESANLPVTYDLWLIDNVTGVRTDVASRTVSTSVVFQDSGMVKGRWYIFFGKAYTKDLTPSVDSPGYDWQRPYQFPKDPKNHKIP